MDEQPYSQRRYRSVMDPRGLRGYRVVQGESDLFVFTEGDASERAAESLSRHRRDLEEFVALCPPFATSFRPVAVTSDAPGIVIAMACAATAFGVGPMASVAGAIAQLVGQDLLELSRNVIVENGGDLFLAGGGRRVVRVFAGASRPRIDVAVEDDAEGIGLCTSSATVGPSVSLGVADAVTVLARTATLADAAATALGNMVRSEADMADALGAAERSEEVTGALIAACGAMGVWGGIELVG
ncbi:MAG: UPF0280 family protein [Actinomycetota bacterium]